MHGVGAVAGHRPDDDGHAEEPDQEAHLDGDVDDDQRRTGLGRPGQDLAVPLAQALVVQRRPVQPATGGDVGALGVGDGRVVVAGQVDPGAGPAVRARPAAQPGDLVPQPPGDRGGAVPVPGALVVDVVADHRPTARCPGKGSTVAPSSSASSPAA